jgi:hypothetical protein
LVAAGSFAFGVDLRLRLALPQAASSLQPNVQPLKLGAGLKLVMTGFY